MTQTPRRPTKKTGMVTERDIAMLHSLSTARFLTAEALEWLHVAGWRARWDRHQERGTSTPYYPSTHLYHRLMVLEDFGFVGRMVRSTQTGFQTFQRLPDVFYLTAAGAQIVSMYMQQPLDRLSFLRARPRSFFRINHAALIGQVYAALQAKLAERTDVRIDGWAGEHVTAKSFDQLTIVQAMDRETPTVVKVGLQPDATFALVHPGGTERVFVEVDRNTRSLRTWIAKILAYQEYLDSPQLQARYGTTTFILLTVTTSATQQHALMEATAGVIGSPSGRYLFALDQAMHPTTVGQQWLRITQIQPGRIAYRPQVVTTAHTFLR